MGYELNKGYQLRTSDFDRFGHVKPASVLDIFQDIAALQANAMGIGTGLMRSEGVFWAVVRMKYEVVAPPQIHSDVVARTWPHTPSRFSFLRDYIMNDATGNVLVKATSEWVLMNMETRMLASVTDHCKAGDDYCEDRAFADKPRRIKPFKEDEAAGAPFSVVPHATDVDLNGHVNNARYAAFVMDALDLGADRVVKTFQMDYRSEVLEGQELRIVTRTVDGAVFAEGINGDGEAAFTCEIGFF